MDFFFCLFWRLLEFLRFFFFHPWSSNFVLLFLLFFEISPGFVVGRGGSKSVDVVGVGCE